MSNKQKEMIMTGKHLISARPGETGGVTDLSADVSCNIGAALKSLLADVFSLYLKTKNSPWHMSEPHIIDCRLLLDRHGMQVFAMIDPIAEIMGQLGGTTLRAIGNNTPTQSAADADDEYIGPQGMLSELRDDTQRLTKTMHEGRKNGDGTGDVGTASLFEVWIDETECRARFRYKAPRHPPRSNS
ncbi:Dps family protein [Dongia soli]|uniref:Ferritin-like domain-containing protein n=1 Tax=Dongia soli TaxID=600628 RepID=A0ABU5EHK0_9PROT|nr:ferritin-like domain-containing protein [Dongia soli]MDY0885914.1 ferritin-like domain-containing protein [Dongia soli]